MADGLNARIFISSVMEGYEAIREAAACGIRHAGCHPVRAEDFPAAATAPRTACLDGVASSDAVVLILGQRYGWITPKGISGTHEEYEEAVRRKKPVLVFLEMVDHEPEQEGFANEVQDYVTGHWRKTFQTAAQLEKLVEEALREFKPTSRTPGVEQNAIHRIDGACQRQHTNQRQQRQAGGGGSTMLQIVWATLRDEEVNDPLFLAKEAEQQVLPLAHEGQPALLNYRFGKEVQPGPSRLSITQTGEQHHRAGQDRVQIDVEPDGTLSISLNVTELHPRDSTDFGAHHYIDPDDVKWRLEQAWGFARKWWEQIDPCSRHDPLLYALALHNTGMRTLAKRAIHGGAVTMPPQCPHDPLFIYDQPRRISRADLQAPCSEIKRAVQMAQLRFDKSGWR